MFQPNITVNLGNLLLSLSDAMDLVNPMIASHQQRTAFIAWELCRAARLSEQETENIFVAALMHDIGAISPEEKIDINRFEEDNTEIHCIRGKLLLESVSWLEPSAKIVRYHHTDWQDWDSGIDTSYVLGAQILFLADHLERSVQRDIYVLHQHESLISLISSYAGTKIHPRIVEYFMSVVHREEFWLDLVSPRLFSLLLHNGPYKRLGIDLSDICTIAELFRNIIDFRSRYTATHSSGVAECAASLARLFGLTPTEVRMVETAGNFHDIGKLVIPNSILNKKGPLTASEIALIKQHPYHTYTILKTIGGLQDIAEWAAFHHEKLDGSGYPFHHGTNAISTQARIIAIADTFTAMSEDRPYRKGLNKRDLIEQLKQDADNSKLDGQIISILFENYDDILDSVQKKQSVIQQHYEEKFSLYEMV
jgi:HD-GYP domain-containing protein (c-di-GMP phosphodiesterase class II)